MDFHVLGPVTVTSGYESLKIGGPKQRTVLAMLISRAGQSLSADVLASAVYGDDVRERSRRLIQTYVSTLRSVVGDVIAKNGIGWSLVAEPADVDAARFYDLYQSARGLDPRDAAVVLHDALSIWRGEPYADVEAHGELDNEIMRLVELRVTVLQARIDADLESGRHAELIGELEALVGEHPYQERFTAQHMLALYRSGRQR
ncbi:MAG: AfsR/SARP family transcriptional regulator, partial [Ilumatobacteraceae bacterium]